MILDSVTGASFESEYDNEYVYEYDAECENEYECEFGGADRLRIAVFHLVGRCEERDLVDVCHLEKSGLRVEDALDA